MGHYYRVNMPQRKYHPIYSTDEVEDFLREKIVGAELRSIFVSGDSMEYVEQYGDVIDFIDDGGELLLAFNSFTLGLIIHGEGLMAYCMLPAISELNPVRISEKEPEDKKDTFYDLGEVYSEYDFGLKVYDMIFDTVEYPLFTIRHWDMEKIHASKKLPASLKLKVQGLDISFYGSTIEYFYIVIKNVD